MRHQQPLIPSFHAFLLTATASLTLFLPAAISMNYIEPSTAFQELRQPASVAPASHHQKDFNIRARQKCRVQPPTTDGVPLAPRHEIHWMPHGKTKGSIALQTAAVVGSSAAVAAAKAAYLGIAPMAVRRFLQRQ